MEYLDLDAELDRLDLNSDWGRVMEITQMREAFPDLQLFRDCWGVVKYCSNEANAEVDLIEMDSCHSCDGQPIKVWSYCHIDPRGTRLYSDPPYFIVADQNSEGFGEIPREGWKELMESFGINRSVIQRVAQHMKAHPPINYFDDDQDKGSEDPEAGS